MTDIEARTALESAVRTLSMRDVIIVLEEYAEELIESAQSADDKLARYRAASDHRNLVNLRARLHH